MSVDKESHLNQAIRLNLKISLRSYFTKGLVKAFKEEAEMIQDITVADLGEGGLTSAEYLFSLYWLTRGFALSAITWAAAPPFKNPCLRPPPFKNSWICPCIIYIENVTATSYISLNASHATFSLSGDCDLHLIVLVRRKDEKIRISLCSQMGNIWRREMSSAHHKSWSDVIMS